MKKQIIFTPDEPNRNLLWLHRKKDKLVLEQFGPTGWESVGTDDQEILDLLAKKADLVDGVVPTDQLPDNLVYTDVNGNIQLGAGTELQGTSGEKHPTIGKTDSYTKVISLPDAEVGMNLKGYTIKVDTSNSVADPNIDGEITIGEWGSGKYGITIRAVTLGVWKEIVYGENYGGTIGTKIIYLSILGKWSTNSWRDIVIPDDRDYIVSENTLTKGTEAGFGMDVFTAEESFATISLGDPEFPLILNTERRPIIITPEKEESLAYESDLESKADLVDGKVPASQLPSYVDDIIEFYDFETIDSAEQEQSLVLKYWPNNTVICESSVEPYKTKYNNKVVSLNRNDSPEDWSIEEPARDKLYFRYTDSSIFRWSGKSWVNIGEDTNKKILALQKKTSEISLGLVSDLYDMDITDQSVLGNIDYAISMYSDYGNVLLRASYAENKTIQLGVAGIDYPNKTISIVLPNSQIDTYQIKGTTGNLTFEKISTTGSIVDIDSSLIGTTITDENVKTKLNLAREILVKSGSAIRTYIFNGDTSSQIRPFIAFLNANTVSILRYNTSSGALSEETKLLAEDAFYYQKYQDAYGLGTKEDVYTRWAIDSNLGTFLVSESELGKTSWTDQEVQNIVFASRLVILTGAIYQSIPRVFYRGEQTTGGGTISFYSILNQNELLEIIWDIASNRFTPPDINRIGLVSDALTYEGYKANDGSLEKEDLYKWLGNFSKEEIVYFNHNGQSTITIEDEALREKLKTAQILVLHNNINDSIVTAISNGDWSNPKYRSFIFIVGAETLVQYVYDTELYTFTKVDQKLASQAIFYDNYTNTGGALSKQDLYKWLVNTTTVKAKHILSSDLNKEITNTTEVAEIKNATVLLVEDPTGIVRAYERGASYAGVTEFASHYDNMNYRRIQFNESTNYLSAITTPRYADDAFFYNGYMEYGGELDKAGVYQYLADLTKAPVAEISSSALGTTITNEALRDRVLKASVVIVTPGEEGTPVLYFYNGKEVSEAEPKTWIRLTGSTNYEYFTCTSAGVLSSVTVSQLAGDALYYSRITSYGAEMTKNQIYQWIAEHTRDGAVLFSTSQTNTVLSDDMVDRLKKASMLIYLNEYSDQYLLAIRINASDVYRWYIFNDPISWNVLTLDVNSKKVIASQQLAVTPIAYYKSIGGPETETIFKNNYKTIFSNTTLIVDGDHLDTPLSGTEAELIANASTILLKRADYPYIILQRVYEPASPNNPNPIFYGWVSNTSFIRGAYNSETSTFSISTRAYLDVFGYYNLKGGSKLLGGVFEPSFVASQEANYVLIRRSQLNQTISDSSLINRILVASEVVLMDDTTSGLVPQIFTRTSGTLDPENSSNQCLWYAMGDATSFSRLSYSVTDNKFTLSSVTISASNDDDIIIEEADLSNQVSEEMAARIASAPQIILRRSEGHDVPCLRSYNDDSISFWGMLSNSYFYRLIFNTSSRVFSSKSLVALPTAYNYYTSAGGSIAEAVFKRNYVNGAEDNVFVISSGQIGGGAISETEYGYLKTASTIIVQTDDGLPLVFHPSGNNSWNGTANVSFLKAYSETQMSKLIFNQTSRKFTSLTSVDISNGQWGYKNYVAGGGTKTLEEYNSALVALIDQGGGLKIVDVDFSTLTQDVSPEVAASIREVDLLRVNNTTTSGSNTLTSTFYLIATKQAFAYDGSNNPGQKAYQGFYPDAGYIYEYIIYPSGSHILSKIDIANKDIAPVEGTYYLDVVYVEYSELGNMIEDTERNRWLDSGYTICVINGEDDEAMRIFLMSHYDNGIYHYSRIAGNNTIETIQYNTEDKSLSNIQTQQFQTVGA